MIGCQHIQIIFIELKMSTGNNLFKPYHGLLTLYAGAIEPQGRHTKHVALNVEYALVVLLSRLRLWQVLGKQGDWPHNSSRDVDLGGR